MVSEKTVIGNGMSQGGPMGSQGGMTFTHGNLFL